MLLMGEGGVEGRERQGGQVQQFQLLKSLHSSSFNLLDGQPPACLSKT